jgi:uncharacterized protein (DUF1697 family)
MATVVFMRGVNVGGHRPFRPAAFAKQLSAFDVVNVGAAGTFLVQKSVSQAKLREEIARRLPFEAELMICRARDIADLVSADPFPLEASADGVRRYVSVLARRPRRKPDLPIRHPRDGEWHEVVGLRGRFALSLWRRTGKSMVYPNEVLEKKLAISATTRNWQTILKVHAILQTD